MSVRTRFAPSPTGFLHIGGVRTALFNWLFARHNGGQFVLRIDDTDQQRHVERAVAMILEGFRWLGMDWDEGPEVGGAHGPYYQSQRGHLYQQAAEALVASGAVYRDYSTEAERAADKAAADAEKRAYRFRRKPLSDAQQAQFEAEGRPFALRFEVPANRTLVVDDMIKGPVEMRTEEVADFVIVRPDGSPLYNFATVVDDAEMQITHVVRAEEHLSNTFPQLLMFEALGYPLPRFAHVPYVASPGSKKKLSKRDGAVGLHEYINEGYLPEGVLNYLARVGWSFDETSEIFSRAELIEKFTLDRVNSSPASHDPDKLFWIEGEWMKVAGLDRKIALTAPYIQNAEAWTAYDLRRKQQKKDVPPPAEDQEILPFLQTPVEVSEADAERAKLVIEALGDRLKVASDIVRLGGYFFTETLTYDPDAVKKRLRKEGVPEILAEVEAILAEVEPFDLETLEARIKAFAETKGEGIGKVVNAVRVATTGQGVGPGLYDCLVILGRESCVRRIAQTRAMLSES